jgi:hypothetical protein
LFKFMLTEDKWKSRYDLDWPGIFELPIIFNVCLNWSKAAYSNKFKQVVVFLNNFTPRNIPLYYSLFWSLTSFLMFYFYIDYSMTNHNLYNYDFQQNNFSIMIIIIWFAVSLHEICCSYNINSGVYKII